MPLMAIGERGGPVEGGGVDANSIRRRFGQPVRKRLGCDDDVGFKLTDDAQQFVDRRCIVHRRVEAACETRSQDRRVGIDTARQRNDDPRFGDLCKGCCVIAHPCCQFGIGRALAVSLDRQLLGPSACFGKKKINRVRQDWRHV